MKKSEEKTHVIRSMRDFEKIYFPKSFEKQMLEKKKRRKERGNQKSSYSQEQEMSRSGERLDFE